MVYQTEKKQNELFFQFVSARIIVIAEAYDIDVFSASALTQIIKLHPLGRRETLCNSVGCAVNSTDRHISI